jgi:DNA-binding CsgD family transcriptional regulator
MKEVLIEKSKLKELYSHRKISAATIAKIYGCNKSTVLRKLWKFEIKVRPPKLPLNIDKRVLYDLYVEERLSTYKIAKKFNCSSVTILFYLRKYKIKTRKLKRIYLRKKDLEVLYLKEKLSLSKIARKYNCNPVTVLNNLRRYKIPLRKSYDWASFIYPKSNFSGSKLEKAYMIGFRCGDLAVKTFKNVIVIKCGTTRKAQLNLIKRVFEEYGKVWTGKPDKHGRIQISVSLNKSFRFLIIKPAKIPKWILDNDKCFYSFLGGYIDAEGNIGVYCNRARLRIGSYDYEIIGDIHKKLNSRGIIAKLNIEKTNTNKDFLRVGISQKNSLEKLLNILKKSVKHQKRYHDLETALINIRERSKR